MKIVLVGYGSRGDVEPVTAVGRELVRRGHDVQMAVTPNMRGFVESAGLAAVPYGPDSREQMTTAAGLIDAYGTSNGLTDVIENASQVRAAKSATLTSLAAGAELLVAGFNEQGLAANVAEYHGVPLAALHLFPARIWSSWELYRHVTKQADNAQRRALNLPETTGSFRALEIQAYDEHCLPGPATEWVDPDDRRPFVGALTLELPGKSDDEVLSWIAAGTPPIYFGFGSSPIASPPETVAVISAACARLGERALVCSGPNDFAGAPRFDHTKIVDEVNHAAIFRACRAVVHHGGAGTTAAGLRAGAPTLILWFWFDQPVWADGIARLKVGSGRAFSASTLDTLTEDLRSILAPECAIRAREVATRMITPAESASRAADLLEDAARLGKI